MLEKLYDIIENTEAEESKTVTEFLSKYAGRCGELEDNFLAAVRDSRKAGFKIGVKAVLTLLSELT